MPTVKPTKKTIFAKEVLDKLIELDDFFNNLTTAQERVAGEELSKVWGTFFGKGGYGAPYEDFTIRVAGVAKAIADEYNLPGDFK